MQLTIGKVVTFSVFQMIRLACLVVGLVAVILAVQYALDKRSEAHHASVTPITMSAMEVQKHLACLARNIYWEAANESFEGKVAVAQVTMNRAASGKFPTNVCDVVHQRNATVCQFSWFCGTTYKTRPIHDQLYRECEEVAKMVFIQGFRLKGLEKAMYYHADYVNPRWNKEKVTKIGRHIFYKDKE